MAITQQAWGEKEFTSKGQERTPQAETMFSTLILAVVTQVYVFVKIHWTEHT